MVWNIVLGVGAAVAGRLIDNEGKKHGEGEQVQAQKVKNKQIHRKLEEAQRELAAKDSSYKEAVGQCEKFKQQATNLVEERDTLARKADSAAKLAAQAAGANLALSLQHQQLAEHYAKLEERAKALLKERNDLAEKMRQLELQQQESAASQAQAMRDLADKITSILKQYFGQHISEAEALLRMSELGVDIDPASVRNMDAARTQGYQVEPRLVLEDLGRMQRLAVAGRSEATPLLGNGPSASSSSSQGRPTVPRLQLNFAGVKENASANSMMLSWSQGGRPQEAASSEPADAQKLLGSSDNSSTAARGSPMKAPAAASSSSSSKGSPVVQERDGKLTITSGKTQSPAKGPTPLSKLFKQSSGSKPRPGRVSLLSEVGSDDQGSFLMDSNSTDLMLAK